MRHLVLAAVLAAALPASAQHLRIGLADDADILDPTLSRTFVGRIVYAGLCDKLFDINDKLEIVPQLATGYRWDSPTQLTVTLRDGVRFHDGEKMDAEAVRYSLNRHLTLQGSFRRSEISSIQSIEVVDPLTVRLLLKAPFVPLVAQLSDRAGMIVSPKAAEAAGREFGNNPVCAGPYRFVERVAQDRIVLERFADHWDAANYHVQRVTYRPIPDGSVRLANLRAGALDLIERLEPTDVADVRANTALRVSQSEWLGYQSIQFNIGNGARADTPLGRDARVRAAFDAAIDRAAIIQVVYGGLWTANAQYVPPANPFYAAAFPPPGRDLARAQALLKEAGVALPVPVTLTVPNAPDQRQVAEVIQAMTAEAGFDVRINAMEFASSLQAAQRGDFEAYFIGWSGRVDPDGNIFSFAHTTGGQNDGKYSNPEMDKLLEAARAESDMAKRRALYADITRILVTEDRPRLYLWSRKNLVGHTAKLTGYVDVPDGLIRLRGVKLD